MGAGVQRPRWVSEPQGIAIYINNPMARAPGNTRSNGGGTWMDLGAVSACRPLLLRDVDLVRMNPNGTNGGSANFGFRPGTNPAVWRASKVDVGAFNGGSSAFSSRAKRADLGGQRE